MWDFETKPELPNSQMDLYYWESPHKQIMEDFRATVVKVVDGDTIRVKWDERDFDFPVRFLGTNAPEMNEGGKEAKEWLESMILNEEVDILIDASQRVGKWGRLLGTIIHDGLNINDLSINMGFATTFEARDEGKIPDINEMIPKWF